MNPNEVSVADFYVTLFAARSDAYASFRHDSWMCVKEPLTAAVVTAAFAGGPSVSGYLISPQSTTHVAAVDFDSDDGLDLAKRLRAAMAEKGITGYVELSRRGAHLWVVLDAEIPARTARRGLVAFLRAAGIPESPKVELRPSHDEIKPDGFGSPIRMPTMPHPKTGRRYPLLDAADQPLSPRLDQMLLAINVSPAWAYAEMADTVRPTPRSVHSGDRRVYQGPTVEGSASDILRRLWGAQDARPNHSIRCPAHSDKIASLSILADDARAVCHAPGCILNNSDRGRGTYELTQMAPTGAT